MVKLFIPFLVLLAFSAHSETRCYKAVFERGIYHELLIKVNDKGSGKYAEAKSKLVKLMSISQRDSQRPNTRKYLSSGQCNMVNGKCELGCSSFDVSIKDALTMNFYAPRNIKTKGRKFTCGKKSKPLSVTLKRTDSRDCSRL